MRTYWGTKEFTRGERRYHEMTTRGIFYELLKKDFEKQAYFNHDEEWIKERIEKIALVASIATEKVDKQDDDE